MDRSDNRVFRRWCIAGVFAVMALASLWHFVYEWLPCGMLAAVSPVNESPWEHAKLFFVPPLVLYTVMYFAIGRRYPNYMFSAALSLVMMPAFMLALYCGYSQLAERTLPMDIANSLLTIALGMWLTYKLSVSGLKLHGPVFTTAAVLIVSGLAVLYGLLTCYPPQNPLFLDRETGRYGILR